MAAMDPVSWDDVVAVTGPPAETVEAHVDRMAPDLQDSTPYEAVKAVHDRLAAGDVAVGPPDQGEVFLVAYLLQRRGVVDHSEGPVDAGVPPVTDRRPEGERLHELFWDPPRTMWWLAVQLGVHWALVRYWLYEENVPLRERNFSAETLAEIRGHRESGAD